MVFFDRCCTLFLSSLTGLVVSKLSSETLSCLWLETKDRQRIPHALKEAALGSLVNGSVVSHDRFRSLLTSLMFPLLTSFVVSSDRFCGIAMGFRVLSRWVSVPVEQHKREDN